MQKWLAASALASLLALPAQGARAETSGPNESAFSAVARPPGVDSNLEWDPIEPVNRGFFVFNDTVDVYALEPVARGWQAVTPRVLRRSIDNFFLNFGYPLRLLGCITQAQLGGTAEETGRFLVNSTVGLLGFFDPATRIGLDPHLEDIGQSFGAWGLGPGPYMMLPVIGPTSTRDLLATVLDFAVGAPPLTGLLRAVNTRAAYLVEVREAKAASLDYYAFVRSAYLQNRRNLVLNRAADAQEPVEGTDDLYELEEETE
jgi:phospholipid-binding lipoprotein MlaA